MTLRTFVTPAFANEAMRRASAARNINVGIENAAAKLRDRARDHSQGRPGPNVITGQFRDAWTYAVGGESATVANGSVYAARLEFGFFGRDSIGRFVHAPPYPSLQPAIAESETLLEDELAKVLF